MYKLDTSKWLGGCQAVTPIFYFKQRKEHGEMLHSREVSAGKFYVDRARRIAREVLEVKKNVIIFITYHLDTGASAGNPSECMKQHFTNWADREATLNEMTNLRSRKMHLL